MKQLIFGLGIAAAGLTGAVVAANEYGVPACDVCCEMHADGFYIGGNLGVITQIALLNEEASNYAIGINHVDTNFTLGGQLGYDWNCDRGLLGLVFDWDWSNIDHTYSALDGGTIKLELDWYLTIRGRAGVTICDWLFYLTAGAAAARFETTWDSIYHKNRTRWGWTGGFGVDYFLGCNWSLGADILYMRFSQDRKTFNPSVALETSGSLWVSRIILNYYFGDLVDHFCCR